MKKTLLALAVLAAAGSANAAEVFKTEDASVNLYGQLREYIESSDIDGKDDPAINKSSSRVGLEITYDVNDDLSVVGKVESALDSGSELRQHYIGFASDTYGSLTFGKHAPLYDDIYGAIYIYHYDMGPYGSDFNDNFFQENSAQYQYENNGFWVKGQYNLPENDKSAEMGELYVGSSFGDLSLHIGGAFMDDSRGKKDAAGVKTYENKYGHVESTYGEFTAEYAIGDGIVGATYAYNKRDSKSLGIKEESNSFHVSAKFPVAEKTSLYGAYQYWDWDYSNGIDRDDTHNLILGAEYKFSSWAVAYVEYNYRDEDKNFTSNDSGDRYDSGAITRSGEGTAKSGEGTANNVVLGARVYW